MAMADDEDGADELVIAHDLYDDEEDEEEVGRAAPARKSAAGRKSLLPASRMGGRKSLVGRRRSSAGRRMSGFGVANDSADQNKLADMYSEIIKLSSQNKINAKNSWNLNLIDHMDRMLLGDETSRSKVNFQKASCTLDASIKIYSYRVDETAASTYRVLENLSRTDLDSAGGEGGGKVAHSKVGTKEASSKLGVADTLEKNLANINLSNVDRAFSVDPLFHKMSKTFDEAGSKGMLLNNLCVRDGCRVMFDSGGDEGEGAKGKGKHAPSSEQSPKVMGRLAADASSLCSKLQDLLGGRDLGSLSLVPQYDDFRAQLAELGDPQAAAAAADVARSEDYNPAEGVDDDDLAPLQPAEAYSDDDDDDCVDVGSGADMESFGGDHMETFGAPSSWGNADDGQRFSPAPAAAPVAPLLGRLCGDMRMVDDEYAFFDARALAAANQWAGAGHWKFAAPPKVATSADRSQHASGEDGAEEGSVPKVGKRTRKAAFMIDFNAPPVPEDVFAQPVAKAAGRGKGRKPAADPTQLTAASLERAAAAAESGGNSLPEDLHFKAQDLARLFLRPNAVARRGGDVEGTSLPFAPSAERGAELFDVDGPEFMDGGMGGGDYDDDDDDDEIEGFHLHALETGGFDGVIEDDLQVEGLLQKARQVEKIEVKYATKAKKVDVRRLKQVMWEHIDEATQVPEERAEEKQEEGTAPKAPEAELAFSGVLGQLVPKEEQAEITVSYYFICLLHLANEKGLRLEGRSDLTDFTIASDPVASQSY